MKKAVGIVIISLIILLLTSCFPDPSLFHSLINITLYNESTYDVHFYSRRVGIEEENEVKDHGIITAGSSKSFERASGYTYEMYCIDITNTITWGPLENVYIDFKENYDWTIEDFPMGGITINNESSSTIEVYINGYLQTSTINSGSNYTFYREIGSYDLIAKATDALKRWQQDNIELTEAGYIWTLEENIEFYPSENYRIWNFEANYQDQNGSDDWGTKVNTTFSSLIKKFGVYSIGKNSDGYSAFANSAEFTFGKDISCAFYVYLDYLYAATSKLLLSLSSGYDQIDVQLTPANNFFLRISKSGSIKLEYTTTFTIEINKWYYIAVVYDFTADIIYLIIDNFIFTSSVIGGAWNGATGAINFRCQDLLNNYHAYFDEAIIFPDQFIDPQVFVDHYTHNVAWGQMYLSAK